VSSNQTASAHAFPPDLLLTLDPASGRGVRAALESELRGAIRDGRLVAGVTLPPSRTLARELGVSRTVVVDAYTQLAAEGYLQARTGSGTFVRGTPEATSPRPADGGPTPVAAFSTGIPDPSLFPRREWQRHHRAALRELTARQLGMPDAAGAEELRIALTRHLGRVRGVVTSPERVFVVNGFTQGLALLCRALRRRGATRLAVEDPCFGFHRRVVMNCGLEPVPVPVDADGLDVDALGATGARAVLVAPAHSFPLGSVLAPDRRLALVEWARRTDGLIVEDDYDAEFRYDRDPIGSLQGLAPERVIYGGGAGKTLSLALRLGWLALPAGLVAPVRREKLLDDLATGTLDQLALARFLDAGDLARHLRRVRPVYRRRRDRTLHALTQHLPAATPRGVAAGLHLYVELPAGLDEAAVAEAARDRGVEVAGAAWHWHDKSSAPPGLVLGYGAVGEAGIERGIAALRDACASAARPRSRCAGP
jgi:GntR family transcriptional regulator/MocR family aminotransferase